MTVAVVCVIYYFLLYTQLLILAEEIVVVCVQFYTILLWQSRQYTVKVGANFKIKIYEIHKNDLLLFCTKFKPYTTK